MKKIVYIILLFFLILTVSAFSKDKLSIGFKWQAYRPYHYFDSKDFEPDYSFYMETQIKKYWGISIDYSFWKRDFYEEYVDMIHKSHLYLNGLSLGIFYKFKIPDSEFIFPYATCGLTLFTTKLENRQIYFQDYYFIGEYVFKDTQSKYGPFISLGFDCRTGKYFFLNFEARYFDLIISDWNDFKFSNWKFGIGIRYRFLN